MAATMMPFHRSMRGSSLMPTAQLTYEFSTERDITFVTTLEQLRPQSAFSIVEAER